MSLRTLDKIDLNNKVVLLRCDLNVPYNNEGEVTDFTKIKRHKPTIDELTDKVARVLIVSHLGRPRGRVKDEFSLNKVMDAFADNIRVEELVMIPDCVGSVVEKTADDLKPGGIALLENIRFYPEEEENNVNFAKKLASSADLFVNDAFSVCHRKHASVSAITDQLPSS